MTKNTQRLVLILILSVLGGAIGPIAKIALKEIPALSLSSIRFLIGILIVVPFFYFASKKRFSFKAFRKLFWISLLGALNITFFIIGLQYTTSINAQIFYTTVPIISAVFSAILLKEKLNFKQILGILIGFLGAILIIILPAIGRNNAFQGSLLGNLLIFIAAVSFTFYSIFSKKVQPQYSPLEISLYFIITTFLSQLILSSTELKTHPLWWTNVSWLGISSVIGVGIIGGLYYLLHQYTLQRTSATITSLMCYLQPITTVILGTIFLGEKITLSFTIGSLLIFAGVALTTYFKEAK